MDIYSIITANPLITVAFSSWAAAQVIKTLLTLLATRSFVPERLYGAGGMPSSHSSLVCSLAVGVARTEGFSSSIFALALIFAGVVMYDAMGVRRAAGEHAKVINRMVFNFNDLTKDLSHLFSSQQVDVQVEEDEPSTALQTSDDPQHSQRKLKEYLGHTPLEVLGGALLGVIMATVIPIT